MRRSYGINWHINTVTGIYDFIKECKAVAINPLELSFDTTINYFILA
jgi:hypothetical protein